MNQLTKFAERNARVLITMAAFVLIFGERTELKPNRIKQATRASRVAGRSATNANAVFALGLQVEQRIERGHAVNLCAWDARSFGDVLQALDRQIFLRLVLLNPLQNREQHARLTRIFRNELIEKLPIFVGQRGAVSGFIHG